MKGLIFGLTCLMLVVMCIPAMATETETYGPTMYDPVGQPAVESVDYDMMNSGVDPLPLICFTWPNGEMECFGSELEMNVAIAASSMPVESFGMESYRSPTGYHRHKLIDGSVIEHSDDNYGSAAAHQKVAGRGWPKYNGTAAPTATRQLVAIACPSCPGGVRYEYRTTAAASGWSSGNVTQSYTQSNWQSSEVAFTNMDRVALLRATPVRTATNRMFGNWQNRKAQRSGFLSRFFGNRSGRLTQSVMRSRSVCN